MKTVINFEDIVFPRVGSVQFGERGNYFINLGGDGPWLILCTTGHKEEQMIKLSADAYSSYMTQNAWPAFYPIGDETALMEFNNLFLSEDNEDKWPRVDFFTRTLRPRGPESSLDRDAEYGFYVPKLVRYNHAVEPGIRFGYVSTNRDDVPAFSDRMTSTVELGGKKYFGELVEI